MFEPAIRWLLIGIIYCLGSYFLTSTAELFGWESPIHERSNFREFAMGFLFSASLWPLTVIVEIWAISHIDA